MSTQAKELIACDIAFFIIGSTSWLFFGESAIYIIIIASLGILTSFTPKHSAIIITKMLHYLGTACHYIYKYRFVLAIISFLILSCIAYRFTMHQNYTDASITGLFMGLSITPFIPDDSIK